ncbi:hypothetical protein AWC05_18870 [Mycobacterium florentinum]|uniref:Uncharacterized protein n=1 Tax=Mycobacterium florentinum TaxID=292462 RepID=A0A1X1UBE1_MYCFL|nr:hypothetical protein [Mycobacterium florentinum]MCV7408218.1 hypothetical protein [Mycobacterium florentinum]ORV54153.1 hypothetical protein AWC05_18870 [Mycobacterium florentinum]BBX78628.1 hypothetical protein MFLOJ_24150 [Mycobacterium florentinum]
MRGLVGALMILSAATLVACSGPSKSTGASANSSARLAAPGEELLASQIPWNQVGPGWILATWSAPQAASQNPPTSAPRPPTQPLTLYLFDPAGGRYAITTIPPSPATEPGGAGNPRDLADWSGDGRHALLEDRFAAGGHITMTDVDLATGTKQSFTIASQGSALGAYSRPTGQAILVSDFDTSSGDYKTYKSTLERIDLRGDKQLAFSTDRLGGAGKFDGGYLQTPDGDQLVLGTDNGMVVMGNDGVITRQLPMPAPRASCRPVRWWTPSVVLAACVVPPGVADGAQLWQVPLDGGAPTALTPVDDGQIGYQNAFRVPSGTFLENVPGCGGDGLLFRLNADMTTTQVTVPGVDSGRTVRVVGVTGDKLLLRTSGNCGSHNAVLRVYDPAANSATVLPGPPGDGSLERAILYPTA